VIGVANPSANGSAATDEVSVQEIGVESNSTVRDVREFAASLVARIHAGEQKAERELVQHFRHGLVALLRRWTGDRALAEDLAHETLVATIERLRDRPLDEPSKLSAFMRGTASNLTIAHKRREARRRTMLVGDAICLYSGDSNDPADLVERAQEIRIVRRLITELRVARDRELLHRYYVTGDNKVQICAELGLGLVHFNRVLHRARKRLCELFDQDWADD
jgi:RNA polymerase sigma factor (sigma-70 family)